jgi:hypothetical protein
MRQNHRPTVRSSANRYPPRSLTRPSAHLAGLPRFDEAVIVVVIGRRNPDTGQTWQYRQEANAWTARLRSRRAHVVAWKRRRLFSLEARIVARHAPRPNRCFGYGIVLAVRRSVVFEKFTHAIVRSVVSRDARPIGQRSFRLDGNRRRYEQVPTYKRERGCVAGLHALGLPERRSTEQ